MSEVPRPGRETLTWAPDLWQRLEAPWTALLERTGEYSPFLSAPWIRCWLDAYGAEQQPDAIVWRSGDEPVGCVLVSTTPGKVGPFPVSRLRLNAAGPAMFAEHNDVLAVAEHREAVVDDLVSVLRSRPVNELRFDGVRPELVSAIRASWPPTAWEGYASASPFVDMGSVRDGHEGYLASVSANARSQIRRSLRIYEERFGPPEMRVAADADEALRFFREMVGLHQASWAERGESGAFGEDSMRFHEALIRDCLDTGGSGGLRVDLVRVRFGETTVGVLYNHVCRDHVQFFQSGLRYDDDKRLKPGLSAHALTIEHYLATDAARYDFGGGEPRPVRYKTRLSNDSMELVWGTLSYPSLYMRVLHGLRSARRPRRGSDQN